MIAFNQKLYILVDDGSASKLFMHDPSTKKKKILVEEGLKYKGLLHIIL
jgi:hypothetical protein